MTSHSASKLFGIRAEAERASGQCTVQSLRQLVFPPLAAKLRELLPPQLLASEDEGPNSRERNYSLRLTFECFVRQMLKRETPCREVVRAVQALFTSVGKGSLDEKTFAYIQARQRLPKERLEKALESTAATADRRVQDQGQLNGRTVKVVDCSTTQLPVPSRIMSAIPSHPARSPAAVLCS